jgi:uncharacterized membrane protein
MYMMLGALLAVLSSATFALNGVSVRRGVLVGSVAQAMAITVPMGVPIFFLAAFLSGHLDALFSFSTNAVALLAAAGISHFVWGRYCNYRSTKAIGSNASLPFHQLDFPLKLGLAIVFLGETLTPLSIFGIGLILIGGAVAIKPKSKRARDESKKMAAATAAAAALAGEESEPIFVPRYAEGYTFALLSITGYGVSPLFIRMALENAGLGASLAGGLISYLAATAVIAAMLLLPGRFAHAIAVNPTSARWFLASAVFVGISQMFRYMALAVAPITVVAPIMRASGLLKVVFNWFVNRQYEVFEPRLLVGIFVSLIGGVVLTLSTDFVATHVPLPAAVISVLGWHWP